MKKCFACKSAEPTWAWQPDLGYETAYLLGSHIRGFMVIKLCQSCKDEIVEGLPVEFDYKGGRFVADGFAQTVRAVPNYVNDPLQGKGKQ